MCHCDRIGFIVNCFKQTKCMIPKEKYMIVLRRFLDVLVDIDVSVDVDIHVIILNISTPACCPELWGFVWQYCFASHNSH